MMMTTKSLELIPEGLITAPSCESWKLYENPFYYHSQNQEEEEQQCQVNKKIAASFLDLTFSRSIMETEMIKLKTELDCERKWRKKAESINIKLSKELSQEKVKSKSMERVCEHLATEMSNSQSEIDRIKKEIEKERKKLRLEQMLREERFQLKLSRSRIVFDDKSTAGQISSSRIENRNPNDEERISGKYSRLVFGERSLSSREQVNNNNSSSSFSSSMRRVSLEAENPHIKRGIKGSVEFSRVVKAIESKSSRHWDTKLECQKAQLKILLKQKSPIRSNRLIMS